MPIPKACQSLHQQLTTKRTALEHLQSSPLYLDHGKPNAGGKLEATQLEKEIAKLESQYDACVKAHPITPFHDPCSADEEAILAAQKVLEHIQANPLYLDHGKPSPGGKLEAENQEKVIAGLTVKYTHCLESHDLDDDTAATFSGLAELTTSLGGGSHHVDIGLFFLKYHHKTLIITSFPELKIPLPDVPTTPTATVTQSGGGNGTCDPATGELELTLGLLIDITDPLGSLHLPSISLSTEGAGSRMDAAGNLTVVGKGVASSHGLLPGIPDEVAVTLTVKGKMSPHP